MTECRIANVQEIIEDFIEEARVDIIGLWEVISVLQEQNVPEAELQQHALKLVEMLLARGLVAGSAPYPGAGRYEPWPDQQASHVIDRIKHEWDALGRTPGVPDIVWFELPSKHPVP